MWRSLPSSGRSIDRNSCSTWDLVFLLLRSIFPSFLCVGCAGGCDARQFPLTRLHSLEQRQIVRQSPGFFPIQKNRQNDCQKIPQLPQSHPVQLNTPKTLGRPPDTPSTI